VTEDVLMEMLVLQKSKLSLPLMTLAFQVSLRFLTSCRFLHRMTSVDVSSFSVLPPVVVVFSFVLVCLRSRQLGYHLLPLG